MVPKSDRVLRRAREARLVKAARSTEAAAPEFGFTHPTQPGNFAQSDRTPSGASQSKALKAPSEPCCCRVPGAAHSAETSPSSFSARPYEVLVAEDHPINLKLVLALLQAAGCRFRCAENGVEALAEFENADFDLIVMDSKMPVMTGIEAIAIIRTRTDWKRSTPILSLTAHAMRGAEEYHTSAGADLYMSKPLQSDCFIGAVKNLARLGRDLRAKNGSGGAGTLPA